METGALPQVADYATRARVAFELRDSVRKQNLIRCR
jgi:hypothetical protein